MPNSSVFKPYGYLVFDLLSCSPLIAKYWDMKVYNSGLLFEIENVFSKKSSRSFFHKKNESIKLYNNFIKFTKKNRWFFINIFLFYLPDNWRSRRRTNCYNRNNLIGKICRHRKNRGSSMWNNHRSNTSRRARRTSTSTRTNASHRNGRSSRRCAKHWGGCWSC